jgi:hypothetical protein
MIATNGRERVELDNGPCLGSHRDGHTCVKATACRKFAVVDARPRHDGTLRLIRLFSDALHARRYNFAIHGEALGE